MNSSVRIGVKQLVDFACRSGNLERNSPRGPSALEGIRAHQQLQRKMADDYQAEVTLGAVLQRGEIEVELSGRVDLLKVDGPMASIAEIKTCHGDPANLPPQQTALHWAQLNIYGYCYLRQHPGSTIELQMLWYDPLQGHIHPQTIDGDYQQLQSFCHRALDRYLHWLQLLADVKQRSRDSAAALDFPFADFRPSQRTMATAIYRCLRDDRQLLCEAPTGIGKTVSALFPALKAFGNAQIDKIVYLTAKNSGRRMAANTLATMRKLGLQTSYLVIQAKNQACACVNRGDCTEAVAICPLTLGFFDRLPAAREQLIRRGDMSSDTISEVAAEHRLCAFELSLQMLPWCDVVICDYNYVFDPLVGLGYFRDNRERIALLVDEAHNLVDRSRQMYSAQLTRSLNQQAVANCKTANPSLSKTLGGVTRALDRWQKLQDASETVVNAAPATVSRAVDRLLKLLAQQAEHSVGIAANVAEWLKEIYRYRHIAEIFGDQHRCITQCRHRGTGRDVRIRLWCVNANTALAAIYRCFHGVVLFSATLRPQTYYREALGLPARTLSLSLPSPFPVDHLGCFVCRAIDTRYHQRPASIEPIAELIHTVYQSRPGNYLVFFPSYQYLQQVAQVLAQQHPTLALVCQQRDADEQARSAFLQQFQARRNTLGLAIMGGVYGEGVDYRGDSLIGAIVVGIGLPAMETEQQLIREDFERKHRNGFDFAYRYPGVARVLQAAGRVIRSDSDRGVVVLIDQRFYRSDYRQLLPEHWLLQPCQTAAQLDSGLRQFWGGHDAEDG